MIGTVEVALSIRIWTRFVIWRIYAWWTCDVLRFRAVHVIRERHNLLLPDTESRGNERRIEQEFNALLTFRNIAGLIEITKAVIVKILSFGIELHIFRWKSTEVSEEHRLHLHGWKVSETRNQQGDSVSARQNSFSYRFT
jgi:hypothetical protein